MIHIAKNIPLTLPQSCGEIEQYFKDRAQAYKDDIELLETVKRFLCYYEYDNDPTSTQTL